MILDALLQLSNAQAVAAAAISTNVIDLGDVTPRRRIGAGEAMSVVVIVTTTAVVAANTFDLAVIASDDPSMSPYDEIIKRRVPGSTLVVGGVFEVPVPSDAPTKRYLGALQRRRGRFGERVGVPRRARRGAGVHGLRQELRRLTVPDGGVRAGRVGGGWALPTRTRA